MSVQRAFTLVELLTVLLILSIMGGMVVAAVRGVGQTASISRTRSIVAAVDSVIQEKYESIRYRAFAVEVPDLFVVPPVTPPTPQTSIGYEVLANEAARVRLVMLRDLIRTELPERYSDIYSNLSTKTIAGPVRIKAACSLIREDAAGDIVGVRTSFTERSALDVNTNVSSTSRAFHARLKNVSPTTTNQNAECLYLIMATTFVAGSPAIDAIPQTNIGDTDDDGVPEILDGWGQPLGFVRWPVGYNDPEVVIDKTIADDFDLFHVDFAYSIADAVTPAMTIAPNSTAVPGAVDVQTGTYKRTTATGETLLKPWAMRPLIVSAGSDGEFGIALNPIDRTGAELDAFSYVNNSWRWPIDSTNMGNESLGRTTSGGYDYIYPDPYMRRFISQNDPGVIDRSATYTTDRRLPGELLLDAEEFVADNITNYELQAAF